MACLYDFALNWTRLHVACFWPNPVKMRQKIKIAEHATYLSKVTVKWYKVL